MSTYEDRMADMLQNMSGDTRRNTDTNVASANKFVSNSPIQSTSNVTFGFDNLYEPFNASRTLSDNAMDLRSEGMINTNPMSRMDELSSRKEQANWNNNPDSIGGNPRAFGGGVTGLSTDSGNSQSSSSSIFGDMTGWEIGKLGLGAGSFGLGVMSYLDAKDANQAREKAMNFDMYNAVRDNQKKDADLAHLKDIFGVNSQTA